MSNSLDYKFLQDTLEKRTYKLSEVKDRIVKVAFDVVKFKDEDEGLWQIQNAEDGDYIIALYNPEEGSNIKEASWTVIMNKLAGDVSFIYKNEYITKMASTQLGVSDPVFIEKTLPKKLAENPRLVQMLLKEVKPEVKAELVKKFPEFK